MMRSRIALLYLTFTFLISVFPSLSSAEILFRDDFEADTIGDPPGNWEHLGPPAGYTGGGMSVVEEDPLDPGNKVFHLIPKAFDNNSHDVWAIHAGDESWVNYVWEFDWLFPEDTYCPMAFRVLSKDEFCQISRRPGGSEFHVYVYSAQQWLSFAIYEFPNEDLKWYRVRVSIADTDLEFRIKERDDPTPFEGMDETTLREEQALGEFFPNGGIGAQEGYTGMIDNVVVGETALDIMAVQPTGKVAACWGMLKHSR